MKPAATFLLGLAAGALLAILLTQPSTGRQASAPRPPAITRTLPPEPVASLGTGAPEANGAVPHLPAASATPAPQPSPTTRTGPASVEPGIGPESPPMQPTSKATPRRTTRPSERLRGVATWYPAGGPVAAAGPALRAALGDGWRGDHVRVCSGDRCVTVELIDWCACGDRHGEPTLLDLGLDAFTRLADPSAGVIDVRVGW